MARELTLDETFERLETAIGKLEQEDISLEESFRVYKEGMKLIKSCNEKIDKVEKEVLKLNGDGGLVLFDIWHSGFLLIWPWGSCPVP